MPTGSRSAGSGDVDTLLERDAELEALRSLLGRANRARGGMAMVAGPPGAGKTALLRSARDLGHRHGLRGLYARGREFERDIGFGVAAGLLGPLVRTAPCEERRRLLHGLPGALLDVLDPASRTGHARPAPAPEQLVLGLYWLVAAVCRAHDETREPVPLLLVVDDAHRTDIRSLQFLCHLADHVDESPVAVVVGARTDGHAARQPWLDRLAARPTTVAVSPGPH